ncbi:phosphotransferase [Phytohabitans suffuscus]|uniref:Aminoglycoside phosphotransferase domain-containing protein n=1 Tax=Phytohabitans suffuscus TaxID=624315 RepID=A0A6F8YTM5_9ACTN|nr:phosphotransferase [Phytohabitans suffuscus]BCB89333.1 hypothetical protein Psuf_066460 [Phytohabitans suffuscus]
MVFDLPVRAVVASVLPDAVLSDVQPVTKGIFNVGWRVATSRGTYLIEINDDPRAEDIFAAARRATHTALTHGVPMPRLLDSGRDDGGRAFLIQEWIDGTGAEDYLITAAGVAERHRLFARLGAVLARLHDIPYADTGPITSAMSHRRSWTATRPASRRGT